MEYKNIIMKYNNMLMFQCNDLKELKNFSCFSIAVATLGMSPSYMGKFWLINKIHSLMSHIYVEIKNLLMHTNFKNRVFKPAVPHNPYNVWKWESELIMKH